MQVTNINYAIQSKKCNYNSQISAENLGIMEKLNSSLELFYYTEKKVNYGSRHSKSGVVKHSKI